MNNLPKEVNKYSEKYFIPGWNVEWKPADINTAVIIPAIKELENIKTLLASLEKLDKHYSAETLFLFVVNNTISSPAEVKQDNKGTIDYLRNVIKGEIYPSLNIGIIDASSKGNELNDKDGGVGLARKIGMDSALLLFDYSNNIPKLLVCLDADCTVSSNYLTGITEHFRKTKAEAASIYFEHCPEPLTDAIICYEIFLRYYVSGLRFAGSPYAFHTIGSSMVCTANSYIKVEGMNKKKAAEDFYFLEKLGKISEITQINNVTVFPSQRGSWRVPFGTGQRVNRYHAQTHDEYLLYNPEIFLLLKQWLLLYKNIGSITPDMILYKAKEINSHMAGFLEQNNFLNDWKNILNTSRTPEQVNKQKHKWFDGFRTLKLIHYLRDNGFPNTDMFRSLNLLFELSGIKIGFRSEEKIPPYEVQMQYLNKLRDLDRNSHT